jgi:hypothetical protein
MYYNALLFLQGEKKCCPLPRGRLYPDAPAVLLDDFLADG